MKTIALASSSPRRKKILEDLSIPFIIINPPFDEVIPLDMSYGLIPEYFAREKVLSVVPLLSDKTITHVIGLDTIVMHNNTIYGKPTDINDARKTLQSLSGTEHSVLTGIAVLNTKTNKIISKTSTNYIKVSEFTDSDIEWYLSKNEWQDAAGAYKIQGCFQRFIYHIEGSFSSVMGLPIFDFYDIMQSQEYDFS